MKKLTISSLSLFLMAGLQLIAEPMKEAPKREPPAEPKVDVYDSDPRHPWNRLYALLYLRDANGKFYGEDEVDPLFRADTRYLLPGEMGPRYQQIIAALDDFLAKRADSVIANPLKRAMFQHDLWAIFDWLPAESGPATAERREIRNRLALIIRRLALSVEEIEVLPDNYEVALAHKTHATKHDPAHAEKAFLPADLFDPKGPWVLLGEHAEPTLAPQHVQFVMGRSAFLILMNLPEGRRSTLTYLEKLRKFPKPLLPEMDEFGRIHGRLNPDLPQFTTGTQLALVRQMTLIDDRGKMRPTRLVESVQLRVIRDVLRGDFHKQTNNDDFYEFTLRRKDLFARNRGLQVVRAEEPRLDLMQLLGEDAYPFAEVVRNAQAGAAKRAKSENLRVICAGCHLPGGIHSMNSFEALPGPYLRPPTLWGHHKRDEEARRVIGWKHGQYSWGLLQGLMEGNKQP